MSQPVVDTLRLCDLLRKTGMEREQAEGMARVLGEELGEHVAVQGDVQSVFRQVRSDLGAEIQQVRSDLGAEIQKVRSDLCAEIQKVRSDLCAEIQQVRCDLEAKIQTVDNKVDLLRAELSGKIDGLNWKLTFLVGGFGLLLSVLTVVSGMGLLDRAPSSGAWNAPAPAGRPRVCTGDAPACPVAETAGGRAPGP